MKPLNTPSDNPHYYAEAMHLISQMPIDEKPSSSSQNSDTVDFEAGAGDKNKSTHRTIEEVLASVAFSTNEIEAIYFGNWLRDYSQLLDPKIVRATTMPKNFPDVLSREALTQIVDVLAIREFPALMKIDREKFKVTPQRLGVYRPSEHIDNPKVVKPEPADPKQRDADFEPWVLPDDPLLQVDFETSKKRYIQRSVDVMVDELKKAMQEGPLSTDGLRSFGAALHILEDFFAHSNFVELSLIKTGYENVLPWTSKADCKQSLPLVTGMFGASDVIASLAAPLGEILFSTKDTTFEPTKAGFRTEQDQLILILLGEHPNAILLPAFEGYLQVRDTWADLPFSEWVEKLQWQLGTPVQVLSNAVGTIMQGMLTLLGNSIDDSQTLLGDNPNTSGSTDPTHSQLAKDHAEHPLHSLAALLARDAVLRVAQAMLGHWEDKPGADPVTVASSYFVHPQDCDWQDGKVREWAEKHPDLVLSSTRKSDLDKVHEHLHNSVVQGLEKFKKDGSRFLNTLISTDTNPLLDIWKLTPTGRAATNIKEFLGPKN